MANINDVATLAGVSVATVSRYFSAPDTVSKKSSLKVKSAIQQLKYKPNLLARNFAKSRSNSILVLAPLVNPFLMKIIQGIEETGRENGYTVFLGDTNYSVATEQFYLDMVDTRLSDGVIQFASRRLVNSDALQLPPTVTLCDEIDNSPFPTIAVDDVKAAENVIDYLLSLGHKNIGCLLGLNTVSATANRLKGYRQSLDKASIPYTDKFLVQGDFSINSGVNAAKVFAQMSPRPTAIFSMNDEMAIGLLQGLKAEGLSIPEDVSIVGFDDIEFAKYCDPPLTTVRQPAKEMGSTAMSVLCNIIENKSMSKSPSQHHLPTDLIVRKSTTSIKI
jgi:LacI family repressor for deo operon, udp, cdd, tsx, nupC, and nupG